MSVDLGVVALRAFLIIKERGPEEEAAPRAWGWDRSPSRSKCGSCRGRGYRADSPGSAWAPRVPGLGAGLCHLLTSEPLCPGLPLPCPE